MELRFEGSEELGYDPLGTPPKGEICLRGPIIFQGYYEDKKKTEEAFGALLPWGQHPDIRLHQSTVPVASCCPVTQFTQPHHRLPSPQS